MAKARSKTLSLTKRQADALWMLLDSMNTARLIDGDKRDAKRWRVLRDKVKWSNCG